MDYCEPLIIFNIELDIEFYEKLLYGRAGGFVCFNKSCLRSELFSVIKIGLPRMLQMQLHFWLYSIGVGRTRPRKTHLVQRFTLCGFELKL